MAGARIKWLALAVSLAGLTALTACTTVGTNTAERRKVDYGPPITLRVCILQAPGVTPEKVASLIRAVNIEFAPYGISVVVPWQRPWARPGFTHTTLLDDVMHRELVPNVLTADPQSYGVGLCVCIDKAGTMTQDPLVLVSSGNNSIDAGAAESLRHRASPFKPMVLDGNPVGGCFPLVLTYELPSPTATTH